jgi:hypothetical protein
MIQTGMSFISIKSGSINLLLALFFVLPCSAQVTQQERYELTLDERSGIENPRVVSLGSEGVLMYRRVRNNSSDLLELIRVDTALRESWRGAITVDRNLMVSKVVARDQTVFLLFQAINYGGFNFNIVTLDVNTRNYNSYIVKNLIPLRATEFKISGNALLIGGYFTDIPVVLHYNLATGRSRLLPGFFNDPGDLNEIKTYDDGLIDIVVSMKNLQRKKVLWIRSYSPEGDLINATILQDPDKNLIFGRTLRKPDGTQVVTGNFNVRNNEYSKGIFFSEIDKSGEYKIKYYNFSDFENFFKYMRPSREARVMARIARKKEDGKKIGLSYLFLNHELQPVGNNYVLVGEVYYPRYYYLNAFGYSTRGERIFDGYRYTHAAIVGFDEQGDLLWDNSFEINDVKTFSLLQFVKTAPRNKKMGLMYLYENDLRSKVIIGDKVVETKTVRPLNSRFQSDRIYDKNTESSLLEYWYEPYFLAYGIQYINNSRSERDNSGRKVLFINKLKFQ